MLATREAEQDSCRNPARGESNARTCEPADSVFVRFHRQARNQTVPPANSNPPANQSDTSVASTMRPWRRIRPEGMSVRESARALQERPWRVSWRISRNEPNPSPVAHPPGSLAAIRDSARSVMRKPSYRPVRSTGTRSSRITATRPPRGLGYGCTTAIAG